MKPKTKALLLNLLCFAILFLAIRYTVTEFISPPYIPLVVGSAVLASFLTPKFGVVKTDKGEQIAVKWFGYKSPKEY